MMSRGSLRGCGRTAAGSPFSGKITLTASVGVKEHECPVLTFPGGNVLKYRSIRFYPLVSLAGRPVPVKFLQLPGKGSGSGGLTAILIALDGSTPGSVNFIASWHEALPLYAVCMWVFPDHGGKTQNAIFSFPWRNIAPGVKRSRFRYPLAFILSSLILLFSASAFPFETQWCMALRMQYSLFPIVLAVFFIHENITFAASHCDFARSMACSRDPLPALSAPVS